MNETLNMVALDLGAESGRAMLAMFDGDKVTLTEAHRFQNTPVKIGPSLYWDIPRQWHEIKQGLSLANKVADGKLASAGIDTWGVDFGLFNTQGRLIGNPMHYRDSRTDGMVEKACEIVPREDIFRQTGIQFMQLNTIFQLYAMVLDNAPELQCADKLLMMPDIFNYWMTGVMAEEFTIATTSQCWSPTANNWAQPLLSSLGIPDRMFVDIVPPGTVIGKPTQEVREETGCGDIVVVAPGCHDTACAIAAVPAKQGNFCYISSGTWSLIGVEVNKPVINDASLQMNMTNEGGVCNTFRLLKNVTGLWLVQECRRQWSKDGKAYDYSELMELALQAKPLRAIINPDDSRFLKPGDMPDKIMTYCRETNQAVPDCVGSVVRCALESLVLKYRSVLENLEVLTGFKPSPVHIVGGGIQNTLLCQLTADALNDIVLAGPIEATAIGNTLMQLVGMKKLSGLDELRAVVRRSFSPAVYEPKGNMDVWLESYDKFNKLPSS